MKLQYLQMRHRLKIVLFFHVHGAGTCRAARVWLRRFSHLSRLLWGIGNAEKSELPLKIGINHTIRYDFKVRILLLV